MTRQSQPIQRNSRCSRLGIRHELLEVGASHSYHRDHRGVEVTRRVAGPHAGYDLKRDDAVTGARRAGM